MTDIGTVLGGRYRLVELLGQGGMATIYRARDAQLERDVAVKVLRPEYGRDPDFFARFRQEAQSAASLNHPGVVAVYDYGTDAAGPFIVMELVDGEDLASIIRRTGALPPRQAARLVSQIARAIGAAHDRGFVHRDIKPGNVLVTREGRAKVGDFGIARALAEAALTLPGTTLGSVHYFSPEQARGELATPASDIYSLGIVLYELLTGRRPWEGDTAAAIATARLTGAVPSPSALRAGVPPALETITRRALAPDPAARYHSANEMADALDRFVAEAAGAGAGASLPAAGIVGGAAGAAGAAGGAAAGLGVGAAMAAGAGPVAGPVPPHATSDASPTIAAGVASANAGARIPYAPDAFADSDTPVPARAGRRAEHAAVVDTAEDRGSGPWLWISALLALGVLALAGFVVFKLLSGTAAPGATKVEVPNLVDKTFEQAQATANGLGLEVVRFAFEPSDKAEGTVLKQDPVAGTSVDKGSAIKLTLAQGAQTAIIPDLRGKTEAQAAILISDAGFTPGTRTEEFDAVMPAGQVVSQDPGPGLSATKGIPINYVISKGPEPTPSPTPEPTPSPTPTPTPVPPTPTPQPPTPTPQPPTPTPQPPTPTPAASVVAVSPGPGSVAPAP